MAAPVLPWDADFVQVDTTVSVIRFFDHGALTVTPARHIDLPLQMTAW